MHRDPPSNRYGELAAFVRPVPEEASDRPVRAWAAVASTFRAWLELAREGALTFAKDAPFATPQLAGTFSSSVRRAPTSAAAARRFCCHPPN
jgi:hypothetical protein